MNKIKPKTVDEYIESKDPEIQEFLINLRKIIKDILPGVTEKIAWNMPSYWKNKYIIHFEAYKDHVNIYVGPEVVEMFKYDYEEEKFTARGLSVYYKSSIPKKLIEEMALASLKLIEQ